MRRTGTLLIGLLLLIAQIAQAQTVRPESDNYWMPTDVQPVGGGEAAKSTNYSLDDTIGESNIGASRSDTYDLGAGYRQTVAPAYLSLTCDDTADLGSVTLSGQRTASATCTVITDADAGYALAWEVRTGSGGTNTGYMISQYEDLISPFTPSVAGTPDTWSVEVTASEWGGRLSSASDDTDAQWGTDSINELWLNVGTGSYTIVSSGQRTDEDGSTEVLQFRTEIGAQKIQPTGLYEATVTLTASAL